MSREKKTFDTMLFGLLTTSENLSKSAHFLDSCNPLWEACQPPINSRSMRNHMTANKPGHAWEVCGPGVKSKAYPF
ncbi:mCG147926 [Mus musculus]|nr:mCG147926 [Mus musculus]